MKKLKTVQDLGNDLLAQMKAKNLCPNDLLDYAVVYPQQEKIYNDEFDLVGDLNYGSNEGIYLDVYIRGDCSDKPGKTVRKLALTFKTLRQDDEALYEMAKLQASCMITFRSYMYKNASDYERRGFKCVKQTNGSGAAIFCESKKKAKLLKEQGYTVTELLTGKNLLPRFSKKGENTCKD